MLEKCKLFENCDIRQVEEFIEKSRHRKDKYLEGQIVARQGEECRSLMILTEGRLVAKMINEDGREIVVENLDTDDVLASAFLFGSENRFPVTLEALEPAEVLYISKDDFIKLVMSDASVLMNFLKEISDRSVFLSKRLQEFALQNLSERIMRYIHKKGSIKSITKVSSVLGVARPSLSRALGMLVNRGFIIKKENIYLLNESKCSSDFGI